MIEAFNKAVLALRPRPLRRSNEVGQAFGVRPGVSSAVLRLREAVANLAQNEKSPSVSKEPPARVPLDLRPPDIRSRHQHDEVRSDSETTERQSMIEALKQKLLNWWPPHLQSRIDHLEEWHMPAVSLQVMHESRGRIKPEPLDAELREMLFGPREEKGLANWWPPHLHERIRDLEPWYMPPEAIEAMYDRRDHVQRVCDDLRAVVSGIRNANPPVA